MNFISRLESAQVQVELKYCERCGGLFLRPQAGEVVYCSRCTADLAARSHVGDGVNRLAAPLAELASRAWQRDPNFRSTNCTRRRELSIWREWQRGRCEHDERPANDHATVDFERSGRAAPFCALWRYGVRPVALQSAHGGAAATLRPSLSRGWPATLSAGTRVFSLPGHIVLDGELRRRRDFRDRHGAQNREARRVRQEAGGDERPGGI